MRTGRLILPVGAAVVAAALVLSARVGGPTPAGHRPATDRRGSPAAEAALLRTVPEIRFDGLPFDQAVEQLGRLSGANVVVNWVALEKAGFDRRAPVRLRLSGVTLARALSALLESTAGEPKARFTTYQGAILISDEWDLSRYGVTRVYDLRDLLGDLPRAADLSYDDGGGHSSGLGAVEVLDDESYLRVSREEAAEGLQDLILQSINPDTWGYNGGHASIRTFGERLVVTTTWDEHRQIARLLEEFRRTGGLGP